MKEDLRKLLDMLYETEALIEMSLRRGKTSSSSTVVRLVADKCRQMASITSEWELSEGDEASTESDSARVYDTLQATEEAEDVALADNTMREIVAMASVDPEEDEAAKEASAKVEVNPKDLEYMTDELDPEIKETVDSVRFDPPEGYDPAANTRQVDASNVAPPIFVEEEDLAESKASDKVDDTDVLKSPERKRAPLLSFFTINDRFRFRRSLFEGSNPKFLESLAVIESLDSQEQAADYMTDDLGWDMDNPEVGLFCRIVDRYFKSSVK